MIKREISFLSSNKKTKIHAIECSPENGTFTRIFQLVHGMCEYIEKYLPFIEYLTSQGFLVVGHDQLGHGQSINTPDELGYFGEPNPAELLVQDIHILRTMTQKKFPKIPYFICGHSMGSYIVRQYICDYSNGLSGVILLGTGYMGPCQTLFALGFIQALSCFKGMKHRSNITKKISIQSGPYKKFDTTETDINNSWISRDTEIVKALYNDKKTRFDFTLNGYYGIVQAIRYCCNPTNVAKINKDVPILFVSGDNDPVGNNGEGVKKSYEVMKLIGSLDVTMKLYENARHEVLNEINRKEVYEYILKWLNEKIKK